MENNEDNWDTPVIEFETPTPQLWRCGLNPNIANYQKRATLCRSLLFITCATAAILGCELWLTKAVAPIAGMVMVGTSILGIAAIGWLSLCTEFCPICGARTKSAWTRLKRVWCPGCEHLNDPQQILVDDSKVLDLTRPEYLYHRDPLPRFVAITVLLAICEKAREVRFEPGKDAYNVIVAHGDEAFELTPPPSFIRFRVAQTVKAIAGLDLSNRGKTQEGHISIRVRDRTIPTDVLVQPTEFGEKVEFRWSPGENKGVS